MKNRRSNYPIMKIMPRPRSPQQPPVGRLIYVAHETPPTQTAALCLPRARLLGDQSQTLLGKMGAGRTFGASTQCHFASMFIFFNSPFILLPRPSVYRLAQHDSLIPRPEAFRSPQHNSLLPRPEAFARHSTIAYFPAEKPSVDPARYFTPPP